MGCRLGWCVNTRVGAPSRSRLSPTWSFRSLLLTRSTRSVGTGSRASFIVPRIFELYTSLYLSVDEKHTNIIIIIHSFKQKYFTTYNIKKKLLIITSCIYSYFLYCEFRVILNLLYLVPIGRTTRHILVFFLRLGSHGDSEVSYSDY